MEDEIYKSNGSHRSMPTEDAEFSEVEIKILRLICKENTSEDISYHLNLSIRVVNRYRQQLLIKTGSKNGIGLCRYAIKHNIFLLI